MCACVLLYNTKLWTHFYISGLTWEQGWLRPVCASSQYDQTLPFVRISSEMGVHTYDTHWLTDNTKKKQLHVAGYYNAEISLHKANIYVVLSIKHSISGTRLNLSLFQNLWFYSLMNVLFSSYHVTAIPSLNHSLLDA